MREGGKRKSNEDEAVEHLPPVETRLVLVVQKIERPRERGGPVGLDGVTGAVQ